MASYRLGFFIAGGSGAGKTSTCLLIAEAIQNIELNKEDYARFKNPEILEAIALDTHAHDPSNARGWDMLGVKAVWEPMAVLQQLDYLEEEFRARKAGRRGNRILVIFDEYGESYKDMRTLLLADEDNSEAYIKRTLTRKSDFIVSLATGGSRKFGIIPVIMNQTWNCRKLRIDASERNNFVGIYLNKLADTFAINAKITDKNILEALAENKDNYRALVSGACPDSFMPHPAFPGKPLSQIGVPPEYIPQVILHEPSIRIVDWGVREPSHGRVTNEVTGESPMGNTKVTEELTVTQPLPPSHGLESLLSLDCEDCHPWELIGLTVEYGGETIIIPPEIIELVAKLKQEGLPKKEIMKQVWGKAWNGDEKSKRISYIYNIIIKYLNV